MCAKWSEPRRGKTASAEQVRCTAMGRIYRYRQAPEGAERPACDLFVALVLFALALAAVGLLIGVAVPRRNPRDTIAASVDYPSAAGRRTEAIGLIPSDAGAGRLASLLDPALCWDDVRELRERWQGPLLLKGVLHPDEARQAVSLGVDGLIVSNHGGRQLDGAISSVEALPGIVEAVRPTHPELPILIDGGIRRGADLVKAIAMGASAGLIGRPQLWGLAVAGEAGVSHVLEIYRREVDRTMGLLGASSIDRIGPELLAHCADLASRA